MNPITPAIISEYVNAVRNTLKDKLSPDELNTLTDSLRDDYYIDLPALGHSCLMLCDYYRLLILPISVARLRSVLPEKVGLYVTTANTNEGGEHFTRIYVDTPASIEYCKDALCALYDALKKQDQGKKPSNASLQRAFSTMAGISSEPVDIPIVEETPVVDPFEPFSNTYEYNIPVYTVIDIETTGLDIYTDEIIEIAGIRVENGKITNTYTQLIQPCAPVPFDITEITGITNEMLTDQPTVSEVMPDFLSFIDDSLLVGHNIATFDLPFLNRVCLETADYKIENPYVDTLSMARNYLSLPNYKLQTVAKGLRVHPGTAHRALGDCQTTQACFALLCDMDDSPIEPIYFTPTPKPQFQKPVQPKITQEQFMRYRSRPKAKDVHPTVTIFDPAHPLYEMTCVITGTLSEISDADAMQSIVDRGGHCADNITKNTDLLIVGGDADPDKKTGKILKAEQYIAKGLPIHIITEQQFLDMLNNIPNIEGPAPNPTPISEAERIFNEIKITLSNALDKYDLDKIQLSLRKPEKADAYHAIELFGQSCMNFKGTKTLYMEVSPKIESLFISAGIALDADRANGWARIPVKEVSLLDQLPLVTEIYETYLCVNGFDCCSHYEECSDTGHCVLSDIMFAGKCTYRKKLRAGRIFFGNRRNV